MSCNWDKPSSSQTDLWLHLCDLLTCLSSSTSPQHSKYLFSYSGIQLHPTGTFTTHPQVERQGTKPPRNAGGRSGKKKREKNHQCTPAPWSISSGRVSESSTRTLPSSHLYPSCPLRKLFPNPCLLEAGLHLSVTWQSSVSYQEQEYYLRDSTTAGRKGDHCIVICELKNPGAEGRFSACPDRQLQRGLCSRGTLSRNWSTSLTSVGGNSLQNQCKEKKKKSGRKEQKRVVWNCWPHAFSRSTKHEALTTPLAALPLKISAGDHTGHLPDWCLPVIHHNFSVIIQRKNQRKQKNIKTASARTQELILCSPTKARAFAKKQLPLLPQDRTRQPQCF